MQTDFQGSFTLLASFDFSTSCPKIKVWCMRSNGILFLKAVSLFSIAYQRPLIIGHGLNILLNINKTSCSHDCIHVLLVSSITVPMYFWRRIQPSPCSSLFAGKLYLSRIKYESSSLCCSIQFSWSAVIPFVDTGTKRLSLIHLHNLENGFHQSHRRLHFLANGYF